MTAHPEEPGRRGSQGWSRHPDRNRDGRRADRPLGRSSLWDDQGSPSIHAADTRIPAPAGRPVPRRTRSGRDPGHRTAATGRPDGGRDAAPDGRDPARLGRSYAPSSRADASPPASGRPGAGGPPPPSRPTRGAGGRPPRGTDSLKWRVVVIPILVLLTIVVIFQATSGPSEPSQTAQEPAAAGSVVTGPSVSASATAPTTGVADPADVAESGDPGAVAPGAVPDLTNRDADGHLAASITAGALPDGADFVVSGAGTFHLVPGTSPTVGTGAQHVTYTIEVEDGLQTPEADQTFAALVDAALADPRSWIGGGAVSLARIDSGDPDFRVTLTSQMTIRAQCGWQIPLEASCFNGWAGRVFINDARWVRGAMSFNGDIDGYRVYAVNHEVGHALGNRHQPCPAQGAPAPVMMQQSWSTSDDDLSVLDPQTIPRDGKVCVANPYPYPDATGVPSPVEPAPTAAAG